jgi:hypothetical protein
VRPSAPPHPWHHQVGDPDLSTAVIAHPGPILGIAVTANGRQLLTAGEGGVVNMWAVDTSPLEQAAAALASAAAREATEVAAASSEAGGAAGGAAAAAVAPGADVGATGADTARWAALVGDAALEERLRDLFCYAQVEQQAAAAHSGLGAGAGAPLVLPGAWRVGLLTRQAWREHAGPEPAVLCVGRRIAPPC